MFDTKIYVKVFQNLLCNKFCTMAARNDANKESKNPADYKAAGVKCQVPDCGKVLGFISSLERHLKTVHKMGKDAVKASMAQIKEDTDKFSERKVCPVTGCRAHFTVVDRLRSHLMNIHMVGEDEVLQLMSGGRKRGGQDNVPTTLR